MRKYVFLFALLVVTAIAAQAVSPVTEVPAEGTTAPTFKLVTNEGKTTKSLEISGQVGGALLFTRKTSPAVALLRRTTSSATWTSTRNCMR